MITVCDHAEGNHHKIGKFKSWFNVALKWTGNAGCFGENCQSLSQIVKKFQLFIYPAQKVSKSCELNLDVWCSLKFSMICFD